MQALDVAEQLLERAGHDRSLARVELLRAEARVLDGDVRDEVEANDIPFAKAVEMGVFCEPAKGVIDFKTFRDVLEEVDFEGWAIVEQDMYPAPFDKPLPIAKRTREYLRQMGFG